MPAVSATKVKLWSYADLMSLRVIYWLLRRKTPDRDLMLLVDGGGQVLDPSAPFFTAEGICGPDLLRPRPDLRIVPGKISGSPHVVHTRLETRALAALAADGFGVDGIHRLYPYVTAAQIEQALDLEKQLGDNLRRTA